MPEGMRLGVPIAGRAAVLRRPRCRRQPTTAAIARFARARREASSRSTSSRSTRPRACSTKGRGWRSATSPRRSRCSRRRRSRCIRSRARSSSAGARPSAVDAFAAFYKLEELRRVRDVTFRRSMRCCCRPCPPPTRSSRCWPIRSSSTAGSAPTPISSICSISAASRCRPRCATTACRSASRCSRPAGTTRLLASIGRVFHADTGLPLGALGAAAAAARDRCRAVPAAGEIAIAVVGAHLSGMPLNGELNALGARLLEETATRAGLPAVCARRRRARRSPGCCASRRARAAPIAVEIWALPRRGLRPVRRRGSAAAVDRHAAAQPTAAR